MGNMVGHPLFSQLNRLDDFWTKIADNILGGLGCLEHGLQPLPCVCIAHSPHASIFPLVHADCFGLGYGPCPLDR